MYQKLKNQFIMSLSHLFSSDEIEIISKQLDIAANDYDISEKETQLVVYEGEIPQLVKTYIVCKKIEGLSEATLYNYSSCLKNFFLEVRRMPEEIIANDIRVYLYRYQEVKKISNRSLDKIRETINNFYKWACDEGYVDKNPCNVIKPIKYEVKPRQAFSQIELEYIRRSCKTLREKAIIEVLYSTGCRVSELSNLKLSDVDWNNNSVHLFGKGNKHRTSFLNAKAQVALKEYLNSRTDNCEYLFITERKPYRQIKKDAIEKVVRLIGGRTEEVSKNISPHILRHSFATTCIQRGMPISDISKLLGHSNLETTLIYSKNSMDNIKHEHQRCVV